jgi:hypothetical protein
MHNTYLPILKILKRTLLSLALLFCFVLSFLFLNQNFKFFVNRADDFNDFRQAQIKGIVTFFDEGRGLKVRVNNQNKTFAFAAGTLVYSNLPYSSQLYKIGDSLIKGSMTDTFKIKSENALFVYVLPREK